MLLSLLLDLAGQCIVSALAGACGDHSLVNEEVRAYCLGRGACVGKLATGTEEAGSSS